MTAVGLLLFFAANFTMGFLLAVLLKCQLTQRQYFAGVVFACVLAVVGVSV